MINGIGSWDVGVGDGAIGQFATRDLASSRLPTGCPSDTPSVHLLRFSNLVGPPLQESHTLPIQWLVELSSRVTTWIDRELGCVEQARHVRLHDRTEIVELFLPDSDPRMTKGPDPGEWKGGFRCSIQ